MFGRVYRRIKVIIFKIFNPRYSKLVLFDIPKIYYKKRLSIGQNTHINDQVFINAAGGVTIGKNSVISHGVTIVSTGLETSKWVGRNPKEDIHVAKSISIGENVWLGANVTVCAGVSIAKDSIIGAGAVVTGDLSEEGCLYGGIPARKIKELKR